MARLIVLLGVSHRTLTFGSHVAAMSPNLPAVPDLSVVVPIYNEQDTIASLLDEIAEACPDAEILIVDDGSSDGTAGILSAWQKQNNWLTILTLAQNSGQGAALYAGLKAARGRLLATLDGDGQNVPGDIPLLIGKLAEDECDLVVGIRVGRRDTWLRKNMSRVANAVRSRILGDGVSDAGCAIKVMRREVVDALIPMQTLYSFVPALVAGGGFKVSEMPVTHRERLGGTSHYSLRKMLWRPLVDMMGVCWFNQRRCNPQVRSSGLGLALIAVGVLAAFFLFLGNHGLFEPDEGRYAEVAKEMSESGDLIMPTLNGFSHVEKPPVIYWFTALSYKIFGVSEFSARLPSTLAALGIVLLTFQIAKEFGSRRSAWLAGLVLASTLQFFVMARLLTADMLMAFWITAAVTCAVKFHFHPEKSGYSWGFFVLMGIGFLTKGPMALVVPISAALGLGWKNAQRPRLPWLRGMPLFLGVAISWFLIVSISHPGLYDYFLNAELKERFLSSNHGRSQPFWFFFPVLAVGLLPWTVFLVPAIFRQLKNREPLTQAARFVLAWILIPLVVLSFSGSKLVTYVLPLYPAFAIAVGLVFAGNRALVRVLGIGAIGFVVAFLFLKGRHQIMVDPLSMVVIAGAGVILLLCSGKSVAPMQQLVAVAVASIVGWVAFVSQADQADHLLGRQASMRRIAAKLNEQELHDDTKIIASNIRAHGLEFYLDRPVEVTELQADLILAPINAQSRRLHRSSKTVASIKRRKGKPTYVVTRRGDWEKYFEPDGRWKTLETSGDFLLLELGIRDEVGDDAAAVSTRG